MKNEIKNNFLDSLEKGLKEDLNSLTIENKKNQESYQKEITELVKKQLVEAEKRLEEKLRNFYYWLFGISLVLLVIIIGLFFYLRKSSTGK